MSRDNKHRRSPAAKRRSKRPQARRHADPNRDPGQDILSHLHWLEKQMVDFQKKQRKGTP
jgi:hypothetical protein